MGIAEIAGRLAAGAQFGSGGRAATIKVHAAGALVLTSGRIVACDPFVCPETPPFAARVAPGKYPVTLFVARLGTDERVAFARVSFGKAAPVRWEPAPLEGAKPGKPGETTFYGVDAGNGGFMDADAAAFLAKSDETFIEDLVGTLDDTYVETWSWINTEIGPANLVAFSSGFGDGAYPTWWEVGAGGEVVGLITDFQVVDDGAAPAGPGEKRWWQVWK